MDNAKKEAELLIEKIKATTLITDDYVYYSTAKQCALIAVDEKIQVLDKISFVIDCLDLRDYYLEIKEEIQKFEI